MSTGIVGRGKKMFEISSIINHVVMITVFVFAIMLLVDYFNVLTKGKTLRD